MQPWKILHSESSQGWGGQEKRILLEMDAARRRGAQVHLVCHPDSQIAARAAVKGFAVHRVPMDPWFKPVAMAGLLDLLRRERYDLIHTHSSGDSWALGVAAKWLGKNRPRVVRTRHLSTPARSMVVYSWLTDKIITTGSSIRADLIRRGIKPEKIVSIPTGVDMAQFCLSDVSREAFRKQLGVEDNTVVIGNVAVMRSWKGHDDFLEVAKAVHREFPHTRFVIAGDGQQREHIEQKVLQEGMKEFVQLVGYREDVPAVMSGLDLFLFTSYANEGVPQAVSQAMAMAKPVVATRVGSTHDVVVDGQTGILTMPRDVGALAAAVMGLLRDPQQARQMGRLGRLRVVRRFSLVQMEEDLWNVYGGVMGVAAPAAPNRPLKIALVRYRVSSFGGAEGVVHRLARELTGRGHHAHVLASDWESPVPGVTYHRIAVRRIFSWLKILSFQRNVRRFLRSHAFDVVHGFDRTYPVDVFRAGDGSHRAWMACAAKNKSPWERPFLWLNPKNWVMLWLEKRLLCDASLKTVIANSEKVRRDLLTYHRLDSSRVVVIHNGIDPDQYHSVQTREERCRYKRDLGLDENVTVALFLGSNYQRKGLRYALDALAANREKRIFLLVAGKGDEKKYRHYANRMTIGRMVRFFGEVKDPKALYRASDLLLLPSLYDPFSNACLEAMVFGIPVITTPENGASEILCPGKTGWVGNPQQMPELLAHALSADLWTMGQAARQAVAEHTFVRMADKILSVYATVCSNTP